MIFRILKTDINPKMSSKIFKFWWTRLTINVIYIFDKKVEKVIYANLYVHSRILLDGYANLGLVQRSQKMFITLKWIWIYCVVKLTIFAMLALYKRCFKT